MKIVVGNKLLELSTEALQQKKDKYNDIEIDLGTGNGRYVYKKALDDLSNLYIGIDPVEKQLRKYSRKAVRKDLENVLFVLASAEMLPKELKNTASKLNIFLPWGSLLDYVANFNPKIINEIKQLLKPNGRLRILFGYNKGQEPTETERLNLEKLTAKYLENELLPQYKKAGFKILECKKLNKKELGEFETSWSKKLKYGKPRSMFILKMQRTANDNNS